jgi:FkbM family methyltransferase
MLFSYKMGRLRSMKFPGVKHPILLRPGTTDFTTFFQVFIEEEYAIPFDANARFVIDGGANVGYFALYIKNKFPETTIVCIEPDPENFELLQKNVAPYDGIYCENCGLWNKDVKLKVYDKYNNGKWGMVVEEDPDNGTIPAMSISTLLEKYAISEIDILKLDIETSEKQLFSENYAAWLSKAKAIVIELHDWLAPNCARTFFQAINSRFSAYKLSIQGENLFVEINPASF